MNYRLHTDLLYFFLFLRDNDNNNNNNNDNNNLPKIKIELKKALKKEHELFRKIFLNCFNIFKFLLIPEIPLVKEDSFLNILEYS